MRRRERSSWIGLDLEPSLEAHRRASRVMGTILAVLWVLLMALFMALGALFTWAYLGGSGS